MSQQSSSFKHINKLGGDVVILKHNHVVDVFFGKDGWNQHSRLVAKRTQRGIFLTHVSGENLPNAIFKFVILEVNK